MDNKNKNETVVSI